MKMNKLLLIPLVLASSLTHATDIVGKVTDNEDGSFTCKVPDLKDGDTFKCGEHGATIKQGKHEENGKETVAKSNMYMTCKYHDPSLDGGEWREKMKALAHDKGYNQIGAITARAPSGQAYITQQTLWTGQHSANLFNYEAWSVGYSIYYYLNVYKGTYSDSKYYTISPNSDCYYKAKSQVTVLFDYKGNIDTVARTTVDGDTGYKKAEDHGSIQVW